MCTRYSFITSINELKRQFDVIIPNQFRLSYNIAPTHHAYIISNDNPEMLQYITWGLIPYWSNEGKNEGKLINARREVISSSPSFRIPIRRQRCLVLADSFYSWQQNGKDTIPYRVLLKDRSLMAMAGVWDVWNKGGYAIKSFAIITVPANDEMKSIHDRMPAILDSPDTQQQWLNTISLESCIDLLDQRKKGLLELYRVSDKINSAYYKGKDLHDEEIEPPINFTLTS